VPSPPPTTKQSHPSRKTFWAKVKASWGSRERKPFADGQRSLTRARRSGKSLSPLPPPAAGLTMIWIFTLYRERSWVKRSTHPAKRGTKYQITNKLQSTNSETLKKISGHCGLKIEIYLGFGTCHLEFITRALGGSSSAGTGVHSCQLVGNPTARRRKKIFPENKPRNRGEWGEIGSAAPGDLF
jgi:hypothetical protein